MDMISSIRNTLIKTPKQTVMLHKGQIIQGKINALYPNNKAEIQIGSERLIAEISAPLSVGKRYLFQVQGNDHHIHLKVIGKSAKRDATFNIQSLMEQLDLKPGKANKIFLDQLINEKIPFHQKQIEQALQILQKSSNKQEAISLLKSMLQQKLPITDTVYQALQSNQTNLFTALLKNVMHALSQTDSPDNTEAKLRQLLENMLIRPQANEQSTPLLKQLNTSESFLNALKTLGLVPITETMSEWKEKVNAYLSSNMSSDHPFKKFSDSQVNHNNLEKSIQQLLQNSTAIQKEALKIRLIYFGLQNGTLTDEQVESFKKMLQKELFPRLPEKTVQIFRQLYNEPNEMAQKKLYQLLQNLNSQNTFKELSAITTEKNQQDPLFLQQSMQEQFLSHIRNYLQTIGITDEYLLKMGFANQSAHQEVVNPSETIKSLLLQLLQGEHGGSSERMQSLLHFINGMQMQSIVEVNNSIQASLLVPGEKLALNKDIFLQFEGQKTKEGQIDAEHCRILFVLQLEHLQETMIDMHVQKRIISVTIFNEHEGPQLGSLKTMLHDQLSRLDYHLTTVSWKPLYEKKELVNNQKNKQEHNEYIEKERFDFLI